MKVEFHFDFGSPNAYLSHLVIPDIESRTGVKIEYVPVLLGGVFKATNNVSPAVSMHGIKNKPEYSQVETKRFLAKHGITSYTSNPFFPVNTLQIMRGAIYAQRSGFFDQYVDEVYKHMWSVPRKMDDPDVIVEALTESGFDIPGFQAGIQNPDVKKALIDNTNRSVDMGCFGSPTFFVDGEIYFGKDKMVEVEEAILKK